MIRSRITRVERQTPTVVTLFFQWEKTVLPGQFIMVWAPGVGEVPMSLSHIQGEKGITIKSYGPTTEAIIKNKEGEYLFFRGPYGKPFTQTQGKRLIIGGGSGMAALRPLIHKESYGIISARNKSEILFSSLFSPGKATIMTDDGTAGKKGFPVDALKEMDLYPFDMIYVCGPEVMLNSVFQYIKNMGLKAEFSLERMMKCGIGVCDSCSISGFQLCKDGPVFQLNIMKNMEEFGVWKLTESGKRVKI
ncbi:dihydroorotate dehydrogenase electron transfer subunit [Oxyplasma meridianum]|uniref:Dihydroorotate dehydrogenase electron transfer subunit n=1 Tax=Oxyplasma meridianum TaxID=3073602 RepID=A0AAX4NFZ1_9ARCH